MNKVVVFDVDGTLCDTREGIISALNYVLSRYNVPSIVKEDEYKYIGPAVKDSFIHYHNFSLNDAEEATKLYREIYVSTYIVKSKLYDGIKKLLKTLKDKGCVLCLATMKTQKQVEKLLGLFSLENCFETIQTAKENNLYSKKMMLEYIYEKYRNSFTDFYMVGDTEGDLSATDLRKYKFIGVCYGYGLKNKESNERVFYCDEVNQLFEILCENKDII